MKKLLIALGVAICFTQCTEPKDEEQREYGKSSVDIDHKK